MKIEPIAYTNERHVDRMDVMGELDHNVGYILDTWYFPVNDSRHFSADMVYYVDLLVIHDRDFDRDIWMNNVKLRLMEMEIRPNDMDMWRHVKYFISFDSTNGAQSTHIKEFAMARGDIPVEW